MAARIIRVICPSCGLTLELPPEQVEVTVFGPRPLVLPGSYYEFDCPDCGHMAKDADATVVQLLDREGCCITWCAIEGHPEHVPGGVPAGPITADELLEFHQALDADGWFAELAHPKDDA